MLATHVRDRLRLIVINVFDGNAFLAAREAGIEPSTLHRILEGKVLEPRIPTVERIAEKMGVPPAWLLGAISTEIAQSTEPKLPEAYWLIVSFYRNKQRPMRARLAAATQLSSEARQLIRKIENFDISPLEGFPSPFITDQLLSTKPTARDLSLIRGCLRLETEVLEYAEYALRRMGVRFTNH